MERVLHNHRRRPFLPPKIDEMVRREVIRKICSDRYVCGDPRLFERPVSMEIRAAFIMTFDVIE